MDTTIWINLPKDPTHCTTAKKSCNPPFIPRLKKKKEKKRKRKRTKQMKPKATQTTTILLQTKPPAPNILCHLHLSHKTLQNKQTQQTSLDIKPSPTKTSKAISTSNKHPPTSNLSKPSNTPKDIQPSSISPIINSVCTSTLI